MIVKPVHDTYCVLTASYGHCSYQDPSNQDPLSQTVVINKAKYGYIYIYIYIYNVSS